MAIGVEGRVAGGTHALLLPSTSLSSLVTGTDKARWEGDAPCRGTVVPGYLPTGDAPHLPMAPANLARGLTRWEKGSGC